MNETNISVITCFYNAEDFIGEFIEHIEEQSYREFELILVNDGSTDHGGNIVDIYLKRFDNIKYISQSNKGLGEARNEGLRHAKGKYIYYLDVDDRIKPDALGKMISIAESCNVDIVTFNSINYDNEFIEEQKSPYKKSKVNRGNYNALTYLDTSLRNQSLYVPVWLYFYRHDFLKNSGVLFLPIVHEDCIYTIHSLINANNIYYLDEVLHERRIAVGSIMHKEISEWRIDCAIKVMKDAEELYNKSYDKHIKSILKRWNYLCSTLAVSAVEDSKYRKKYRKQMLVYFLKHTYMMDLKCCIRLLMLFLK
jgi:glycosyltransferase involved in cell wall biosynthesis